jgi:hypothetical protein
MDGVDRRNLPGSSDDGSGRRAGGEPASEDPDPAFSPEGVDLTLIRWMLSLSPSDRLRALEGFAGSILRIRGDGPEV